MEMNDSKVVDLQDVGKKSSFWKEVFIRMLRNKGAIIGMIVLVVIILISCSADLLFDYKTQVIAQNISERLQPPSAAHPFGTDEYGRDLLARIVYGSRMSLVVGFSSVFLGMLLGGIVGSIAGYYRGMVDNILMRTTDVLLAIPMIMLALVIVSALGPSTINLIIALSFASLPSFARIVRAAIITVRDSEYIEAARAIGATDFIIIIKHILPNCLGPIIVQVTIQTARAILNTAALSFLGLGVQPPTPEWGALLASGRTYIRDSGYLCVIPGLAIMVTVLSLNLMGDGLRDALDPKLK